MEGIPTRGLASAKRRFDSQLLILKSSGKSLSFYYAGVEGIESQVLALLDSRPRLLRYRFVRQFDSSLEDKKIQAQCLASLSCRGGGNRTPSRGFGDRWFTVNRHPHYSESNMASITREDYHAK